MISDLEDQLTAGMRDEVAGLTLTRDVLGEATRRHRRRTALHRTAYATGVVGMVAALAAVVTLGTGAPGGTTRSPGLVAEPPATTTADTPQMRLAAAAAATENISYRMKVTTTSKDKPAKPGELPEPQSQSWVTTGAFDPATATGYLDSPYTGLRPVIAAGFEHERLINGVLYVGGRDGSDPDNGKILWSRYPGKQDNLDYDMAMGGGLGASASPQKLFGMLSEAGATVTETAAGVYHFEVTVKDRPEILADTFVGEVTVGADNRIAKVAYARTTRTNIRSSNFTYHLEVVIELSDYGMPVTVEAPAGAYVMPSK